MNKILELHSMAKGTECEVTGVITYAAEPKPVKYGQGLNQFVVIEDNTEGGMSSVGVNISLSKVEDGFKKGEKVVITGKVDKYPDRKQPLQQDGTFPTKTSLKAVSVEKIVEATDFHEQEEASSAPVEEVMSEEDIKEADKPAENNYVTEKEKERIMWEKKDLVVAKESACKTVATWIVSGHVQLKDYFAWVEKLVDCFYSQDDKFATITQANLMSSKLVTVTKTEALIWIRDHMWNTEHTTEADLIKALHVKPFDKQLLPELLDTIERLSLILV